MAPSLSEAEADKPIEYVSIKFLLKQVYAAHTAAIKDLESEIQNLKEQLQIAQQNKVSAPSNCDKCKKLESAYTACKEEYKNAVLEQTRRLKEFESIFDLNKRSTASSLTNKTEPSKSETLLESPNEKYCLTNVAKLKEISPKLSLHSKSETLNKHSAVILPPQSSVGTTKKRRSSGTDYLNNSDSEADDSVLVPDTEGFDINTTKDKSPKSKGKKRKNSKLYAALKENSPDLDDNITQIPKANAFKKRALNELKLNDAENNHQTDASRKNSTSPKHTAVGKTSPQASHNPKRSKVSEINGKWAEDFIKDFGISAPSIPKLSKFKDDVSIQEMSDDDFEIKPVDENGLWKTSVKKKETKKLPGLKTIKSTSRFKMTLEGPDSTEKKNFKQTKLSKSSFIVVRQSLNSLDKSSAEEEISQEKSSVANASELASLAKNESSLPDLGSETFCPLEMIAHSKSMTTEDEPAHSGNNEITVVDESLKEPEENSDEVFSDCCDSFDQLPIAEEPNYKYKEDPVRDKNKRKQLNAHDCKECEKYYSDLGLSEAEKKDRMKQCSRHRAKYVPPSTPEHFWEIEFPNTEVCKARGYVAETQKVKLQSRRRRPLLSK